MTLTRRSALQLVAGAAAVAALPAGRLFAATDADEVAAAIDAFTGGGAVAEGGVEIVAPEIAENGNTVPIEVSAAGASAILVLATGNPSPGIGEFRFGALAEPAASIRIRLAGTQDIVAVAKMADGSFARSSRAVKVTIGGCGG